MYLFEHHDGWADERTSWMLVLRLLDDCFVLGLLWQSCWLLLDWIDNHNLAIIFLANWSFSNSILWIAIVLPFHMVHDLIPALILIEAAWETAIVSMLLHSVKFNIIIARSIYWIYTQTIGQKSSKIRYLLVSTENYRFYRNYRFFCIAIFSVDEKVGVKIFMKHNSTWPQFLYSLISARVSPKSQRWGVQLI